MKVRLVTKCGCERIIERASLPIGDISMPLDYGRARPAGASWNPPPPGYVHQTRSFSCKLDPSFADDMPTYLEVE